jgi:hypothetical protein
MKIATKLFSMPVIIGLLLLLVYNSSCQKESSKNSTPAATIINDDIPNSNFSALNPQELKFENIYYAMGSSAYNNNNKVAVNGESVGKIPDRKGHADLLYAGIPQPTLTGVPPQLIDDRWLMFDNRPNTYYNSLPVAPINPPFEATLISRNMPGQLFEAKMQNGNNGLYCGDIGSPIRVFDSNGIIPNSSKARNYEVSIERIVVKQGGVDYWLNGKYIGTYSFTGLSTQAVLANTIKKFHSMGTFTNSMDFDFGALYFRSGTFTDNEYGEVYASLASKWNVGTTPDQILLSNINWVNKNGTYTPSSIVINTPEGVTVADPSQWDYQWFWKSDETNYDTQTLFSTKMVVNVGDFPANDQTHHNVAIKFRVRPKDSKGKSWRYFSGIFSDARQSVQ